MADDNDVSIRFGAGLEGVEEGSNEAKEKIAELVVTADALEWIVADLRPRMIEMMLRPAAPAGLIQMMRLERELYETRFGVSAATPERQAEWAAATPGGAMTRQ